MGECLAKNMIKDRDKFFIVFSDLRQMMLKLGRNIRRGIL